MAPCLLSTEPSFKALHYTVKLILTETCIAQPNHRSVFSELAGVDIRDPIIDNAISTRTGV